MDTNYDHDDLSFMAKDFHDSSYYDDDNDMLTTKSYNSDNHNPNKSHKEINLKINAADNYKNDHSHPYDNEVTREIYRVGNTSVGMSQAKLYGLCDTHGNLKLPRKSNEKEPAIYERINSLSKPKKQSSDNYLTNTIKNEDKEYRTLKKKALRAMRDPSCGYDFVDRLKDRGDLIDRLANNLTNYESAKKKQSELDYDALVDKLCCPKCKKNQSFEEFYENKRSCSACNVNFIKPTICNMRSFESRMKQHQAKKEQKLAEIDSEMYGETGRLKLLSRGRREGGITSLLSSPLSRNKKDFDQTQESKKRDDFSSENPRYKSEKFERKNESLSKTIDSYATNSSEEYILKTKSTNQFYKKSDFSSNSRNINTEKSKSRHEEIRINTQSSQLPHSSQSDRHTKLDYKQNQKFDTIATEKFQKLLEC
jgi:hypothetical protein